MSSESEPSSHDLKPLYVRSVVSSFGLGTVSPFLGVYAVQLGASASEMGWFQSVSNLAPNIAQIPWGKLSDKIGKRIPFILFGGVITALLWVPLLFVTSAQQLILVIAVQSVLGSMATPTWIALIGDLVKSSKRGIATATLNRSAAFGSLLATLIAGYLMVLVKSTTSDVSSLHQMYLLPFVIAIFCGIVSSLAIILVHEKSHPNNPTRHSIFGFMDVFKQMRSMPNFSRYCTASVIFGFFMSISWPLFSITLVSVLNASMWEVALVSVIQGAVAISLQPLGGKLVDRVGRRQLIVIYRFGLILVPLFYAFAASIYHLYALSLVLGVLTSVGDIAMLAYLLDVTPEEQRGTLSAFYNLVTGSVFFVGSLIGGYLSDYLLTILGVVNIVLALQIVYLISAVGRGVGALTFISLKEPYSYPSTLKRELWEFVQKIPH